MFIAVSREGNGVQGNRTKVGVQLTFLGYFLAPHDLEQITGSEVHFRHYEMEITSSFHKIVVRTKCDALDIKVFLSCRVLYKNQLLLLLVK